MFGLSLTTLLVDLFALGAIAFGLALVFAQHRLRRWLAKARGARPPVFHAHGEDPAHYAMIISGMMLAAFGLLIGAFRTMLDLMR